MSSYMQHELLFFCRAFFAGVCLVVCYDGLRILRNLVKHSAFFIGAEDLLYWCAAGFFLFSVIYLENDGVIRVYALLGVSFGAFVYHTGISGILVKYLTLFLKEVGKTFGILKKPLRIWRKRLKFWLAGVKIALYEQKSIQRIRKRKNEKKRIRKEKQKKKKNKSSK